jgi:predicted N-acyltransferase
MMGRDWLEHETAMEKAGFHAINFQPSMIMELPSNWKTMDDYLNAMSSKYRVRARRALKKASGVIFRELDLRQIELFNDDLVALHYAVVDQADFNMMWAGKDYFIQLKQQLGADFCLTACFEKDQLLGFFTTIRNGKELEANFLGFDAQANREHQLYLCMLYKMIELALANHCTKISFARTALEIKSSVGAVAHKTYIYMKHTNPFLNWLLPAIVRFGDPKEEWTPRHPFREE